MKRALDRPSYYDIQRGCSILAREISRASERAIHTAPFTMIVALSRGGLIPGVELSHQMSLPLTPVCYSAKKGHGDNKNHLNVLPELPILKDDGIILVDDICDSGHTLAEVQEHYSARHKVWTAVLYWRVGSAHTPNFCWQRLSKDDPWIVFPWEL